MTRGLNSRGLSFPWGFLWGFVALSVTLHVSALPVQAGDDDACEAQMRSAGDRVAELHQLRAAVDRTIPLMDHPMLFVTTAKETFEISRRMARAHPLGEEVKEAIRNALAQNTEISAELEARFLTHARELAALPSTVGARQALMAAQASDALQQLEYYHRLRRVVDSDSGQPAQEERAPEQPQQPPPPPSEQTPPDYPDMAEDYQAHNKNTDQSQQDGTPQQKVSVAKVNRPKIRYFRSLRYQIVDPRQNRVATVEITDPPLVSVSVRPVATLEVKPGRRKGTDVKLMVPVGFVPMEFRTPAARVWRDKSGNFLFNTTQDVLEIPLFEQGVASRPLTPGELAIYTMPTGVRLEEWPGQIQEAVLALKNHRERVYSGPGGNVRLARDLARFISLLYKYRVDADPERLSAMAHAHDGKFQCDTAAVITCSLLRDHFSIACAVEGGFRGSEHLDRADESHVVLPADGHAWVSVPDEAGNWWGVDPTPLKRDRETQDQQDPNSQFRPISSEQSQSSMDESDRSSSSRFDGSTPQSPEAEGSESASLEELIQQTAERQRLRREQRAERVQRQESSSESDAPREVFENQPGTDGESSSNDPLPSVFDRIDVNNQISKSMLERLYLWTIDPKIKLSEKQQRLQFVKGTMSAPGSEGFRFTQQFRDLLREAILTFDSGLDLSFAQAILAALADAPRRDLNTTVSNLFGIHRQVLATMSAAGSRNSAILREVEQAFTALKHELTALAHPDARAIRIAQEMLDNLPGNISRQVLRERYQLGERVDADAFSLAFARDIVAGRLNDFRYQAILGPHTEFLTRPFFKPSAGSIRTLIRTLDTRSPRELGLTNDPRDFRHFVRLHPHLSDAEALARHEMGVLLRRGRARAPRGRAQTSPERVTVIMIDTSGSMAGERGTFQGNYVGALVDRAFSEQGSARVFILPFGDTVLDAVEVTSKEQAVEFLRNLASRTANTGSGTNIYEAIKTGALKIREAASQGDRGLARANLILASDGGAEITDAQRDELHALISGLGNRDTEILFGFIAIGGHNAVLEALASRNDLGADQSFFQEWNAQDISRLATLATALREPLSDFWTTQSYDALPPGVRRALDRLRDAAQRLEHALDGAGHGADQLSPIWADLRLQDSSGVERVTHRPGSTGHDLMAFRRLLKHLGPHLSESVRRQLLEEALPALRAVVGVPLQEMDRDEVAQLRYILSWPTHPLAGDE